MKKKLPAIIIALIMTICAGTILTGCGSDGSETCEIGSATFTLPEGWSNSWKKNEYSSEDKNSYIKAGADDEQSYDKSVSECWESTLEAEKSGKSGYSDVSKKKMDIDGHEATRISYMLEDDGVYYCSIIIIEDASGIVNIAFSGREQSEEINTFDEIINSINF